MILPKREQQQSLPCCENLRPIYPPPPPDYDYCRPRRRRRCRPRCRCRKCYIPPPVEPIIIAPSRYLNLPPIPAPPPKPPRSIFDIGYVIDPSITTTTTTVTDCTPKVCCPPPEPVCECVDCCD